MSKVMHPFEILEETFSTRYFNQAFKPAFQKLIWQMIKADTVAHGHKHYAHIGAYKILCYGLFSFKVWLHECVVICLHSVDLTSNDIYETIPLYLPD